MKKITILVLALLSAGFVFSQNTTATEEMNKKIAQDFYNDLWFSNNTANYKKYVADSYVVHDIGDRKGITEAAIEQKKIADFFWENGKFEGQIDYQIAEGDLVATRWTSSFDADTFLGKIAIETKEPISIINVFRIKDGKIVEFWNHRHDIDTPQTMRFTFKGFLFGLLLALIPTVIALRLLRKLRKVTSIPS